MLEELSNEETDLDVWDEELSKGVGITSVAGVVLVLSEPMFSEAAWSWE